jgi:hypothetical protein
MNVRKCDRTGVPLPGLATNGRIVSDDEEPPEGGPAVPPPEPFGREVVEEGRQRRLEEAKKSYELALNRLWAGNAAGIFAALGAFISGKAQSLLVFAALCAFAVGVAVLGAGALWSLIDQTRVLRAYERALGVLDLPVSLKRPSVAAGFSLSEFQTVMAVISGLCFFVGVGFGLCAAYRALA